MQPSDASATARATGLARRYLDAVAASLVNLDHLEHELRLTHLLGRLRSAQPVDPEVLRDPRRAQQDEFRKLEARRRGGVPLTGPATDLAPWGPPATDLATLRVLEQALDDTVGSGISGDVVDLGTSRGGTAAFARAYLAAHEIPDPMVWVDRPVPCRRHGFGPPDHP